jgi:hypothetical protein
MATAFGIAALGISILIISGQISFGHALYVCAGGYIAAFAVREWAFLDSAVLLCIGALTGAVLGVIIGGRLGYALFYKPGYYLSHPLEVLMVWKGGMSFHGGLLGVLLALATFAKLRGRTFLGVTDVVAPCVPTGIAAVRLGRGPSIMTTIVGTSAFVYFFVPNRYSFVMADLTYLQTFTIMIVVGILVSTLTSQLRAELLATEARERRSRALYELSRALTGGETTAQIEQIVREHVELAFRARGRLLPAPPREPQPDTGAPVRLPLSVADLAAAERACETRQPQRTGAMHLQPLIVANQVVGVLACETVEPSAITSRGDSRVLPGSRTTASIDPLISPASGMSNEASQSSAT